MKTIRAKYKKQLVIVLSLVFVIVGVISILPRLTGARDCTSVEQYDFVRDECYFECGSDKQCEALSKQVDQELSDSLKDSKTKAATAKPKPSISVDNGELYTLNSTGSETKGTVYTVRSNNLEPSLSKSDQELWNIVNALIGSNNVQKHIISFEVFNDENNDTAASVWRSKKNASQWHMNINAAYASESKKDLIRTIVHEYGHIITLSGDQVNSVSGSCPNIELDEGCGGSDSYINAYYKKFWKDYGFDPDQVGSISENDARDLYANKPEAFVSEYASSNITEDIAESFADFVTKSKPNTNAIKDQKITIFYQYPELVAMREQIRLAMAKAIL